MNNLFESYINNLNKAINYSTLPKPTSKTNFEGFDISKVSDGYTQYQEFLDNSNIAKEKGFTNVYITETTPQEYMDLLRLYIATNIETNFDILTDREGIQKHFAETCYLYAEKMKNGEKFPLPILDLHWKEQDGRHRVTAAYINKYDKVPVLLCY